MSCFVCTSHTDEVDKDALQREQPFPFMGSKISLPVHPFYTLGFRGFGNVYRKHVYFHGNCIFKQLYEPLSKRAEIRSDAT